MRVLILGGTVFLGRHIALASIARGHEVTLFHRGRSNPGAFPNVEQILGDRDLDLSVLHGRTWDAVIDTSGYEVRAVRNAARAVAHAHLHYVFVSSISVYADLVHMDEGAPVKSMADADNAALTLESYGALKADCERAVESELPGRVQHVRAGIILGPDDYDLRFPYWLRRVARGGDVLSPGDPDARVQFIDVRDLAAWILSCVERRVTGPVNATGPREPMTMRSLLDTIRAVTGGDARWVWVPDDVLVSHQVAPYSEMPFWLPAALGHVPVNIGRALNEGLAHRPAIETVRDAWSWLQTAGADTTALARTHRKLLVPGGMSPEREQQILSTFG